MSEVLQQIEKETMIYVIMIPYRRATFSSKFVQRSFVVIYLPLALGPSHIHGY